MRKVFIRLTSFLLLLSLLGNLLATVSASEIVPRYTNVNCCTAEIKVPSSSGSSVCFASLVAKEATTSLRLSVALQRYVNGTWVTVASWIVSGTGHASISDKYTLARGYTYRLRACGYLFSTNGTIVESAEAIYEYIYN